MQRLFLLLVLVLCSGSTSSAQSSAYNSAQNCTASEGRVERPGYRSRLISTNMVYSIYLPPCYDAEVSATYPTLYLLHGSNEDDQHWLRLGLQETLDARITAGDLPPMIVVLPFGNWIANENVFDDASWQNVLLTELLPLVETDYRIDSERRAIGGISRGGFWAFNIALRHPHLFRAVGGHSAFFAQRQGPPEHTPLDLAASAAETLGELHIWLDRGAQDYAAPGLDLMHDTLNAAGVHHTYTVYPQGQHNNAYWREHLNTYLDFYAFALQDTQGASAADFGYTLFLPVVPLTSLLFNLERQTLEDVAAGDAVPQLLLDEQTAANFRSQGMPLHTDTEIVPPDALRQRLQREPRRFALLPFEEITPDLRVLWVNEGHPLDDLETYPLAFQGGAYRPERLTRILVSGVTALTRNMLPVLHEKGVAWAAGGIRPYAAQADYFHISNEVSFVPGCPAATAELLGGSSSFCSVPEHFALFDLLDVDIVELSGNHNNDYGYDAYLETLNWYRERGMATVGGGDTLSSASAPLVLSHHGNEIAWVSCNWVGPYYALVNEDPALLGGQRPGAAPCDYDTLRTTLPLLRAEHDLLIVTLQHEEFDQHSPTEKQRSDFLFLAEHGADVVIGTQAHVAQTLETSGGAFLHYGLGNLYFDQPFWATTRFFMDQLFIYDGRLMFVDLYPGIIEETARPRPMTPEERENFLYVVFSAATQTTHTGPDR